MLKGFRDFILRGNVVDLAVAVVVGAAFTAIVNSFVTNILNPLIAATVGKPNFGYILFHLGKGEIKMGEFLNATIYFVIVAAVVYFGVVMPMTWFLQRVKRGEAAPAAAPVTKKCPECLSEIPLEARRCAHCTQPVPAV
ncbi:MAG TPA: large conductance mechanosensitive channel protein MscL [Terracidiphilus sp.]|jgi:large conductance mechanosensitive channel